MSSFIIGASDFAEGSPEEDRQRILESVAAYYNQALPRATGATAGIPGTWTPAGSLPRASVTDMAGCTASPGTAWTTGQFVQTQVAGAPGRVSWSGTNWVGGAAP